MCGILFSYSGDTDHQPSRNDLELLRDRGPDHAGQVVVKHTSGSFSFVSSVLSLRGKSLVTQPLQDSFSGSVLCWNGEAWKFDDKLIEENDARVVFEVLLKTVGSDDSFPVSDRQRDVDEAVAQVFSRISGPYAFIFYDATNRSVYYGRDFLGRRSLLRSGEAGSITITSVCSGSSARGWAEVEANGIYVLRFRHSPSSKHIDKTERHIAWLESNERHKAVSRLSYPSPSVKV